MPLTNSQYDTVMRAYEEKQRTARYRLEQNTQNVYKKIPAYQELDKQAATISVAQGRKLLEGDKNALAELKQLLRDLSDKKASLLREHGFPADYLTPVYACEKCQDTGYKIGRASCRERV